MCIKFSVVWFWMELNLIFLRLDQVTSRLGKKNYRKGNYTEDKDPSQSHSIQKCTKITCFKFKFFYCCQKKNNEERKRWEEMWHNCSCTSQLEEGRQLGYVWVEILTQFEWVTFTFSLRNITTSTIVTSKPWTSIDPHLKRSQGEKHQGNEFLGLETDSCFQLCSLSTQWNNRKLCHVFHGVGITIPVISYKANWVALTCFEVGLGLVLPIQRNTNQSRKTQTN